MFESESKLDAYFHNVATRLEPGGFFIGTTIDSDELVYRIRQTPDNTLQNEFFKIVMPQDTFDKNQSPFGLKYYFFLKDAIGKEKSGNWVMANEFLVIFQILE